MSKSLRWWLAAAALALLSACGEENPVFQDAGPDATVFDVVADRVYPSSDLGTFDGIRTSALGEVLRDDGVAIPGLYAAQVGGTAGPRPAHGT